MKEHKEVNRSRNGIKVLFWIGFLAFFAYSFQSIMDFKGITNPRRQESFIYILTALSKPNFLEGETYRNIAVKMWETVQIAFLATTISAVLAIPFTFLSTRPSVWARGFNILVQPILSIVRAVHPLIFSMPAIVLAGIGPTAGVLALTIFSTAVLIGIFSEYTLQHKSLNWAILFKVYFPGLTLKHLPVNLLIATILGFMGGGGIGFLLQQEFSLLNYHNASVAILACIIVIGSIDLLSRAVWREIQTNLEVTNHS